MENPAVVPNLTGIALSVGERQMGPINGGPINLSSARLRHASLRFAMLTGADLSTAGLWDADLSDARLDRANLAGADLSEALLDRAISLALDSRAPISRVLVRSLSWPLVHLRRPPPHVAHRPILIAHGRDATDVAPQTEAPTRAKLRQAWLERVQAGCEQALGNSA
jgi:uncharacterized protein YjbI with pentapeptide repeats